MYTSQDYEKVQLFLFKNGLTIVLLIFFALSMTGQIITGLHEYNIELQEYRHGAVTLKQYLKSGHFIQTTFENWESEFLQMAMYVILTIWLRQIGSSESKDIGPGLNNKLPHSSVGLLWRRLEQGRLSFDGNL